MKATLEKLLAKILTRPQMQSTLYTTTRTIGAGSALGFYVNKSALDLPSGAEIKGLIVEQTQSNGHVTGTAFDINATQIYVGLFNNYTSALTGTVSVRVLYEA